MCINHDIFSADSHGNRDKKNRFERLFLQSESIVTLWTCSGAFEITSHLVIEAAATEATAEEETVHGTNGSAVIDTLVINIKPQLLLTVVLHMAEK